MIPHEERLENLLILLQDNDNIATSSSASVIDLPTIDELKKELLLHNIDKSPAPSRVNGMCIVLWLEDRLQYKWYLGYVTGLSEKKYTVEHLIRSSDGKNDFWKHPPVEDIQEVEDEQFLDLKINGEWEVEKVSGNRMSMKYHLKNSKEIDN